jgi:transposase-like protein
MEKRFEKRLNARKAARALVVSRRVVSVDAVSKTARAADVSWNNSRRWNKELAQEAAVAHLDTNERASLARLRREVKELWMENEILKKCLARYPAGLDHKSAEMAYIVLRGVRKA